MFVQVNGERLYFDVEGAGLVPDRPTMHQAYTGSLTWRTRLRQIPFQAGILWAMGVVRAATQGAGLEQIGTRRG
jgi:hypothetical protein